MDGIVVAYPEQTRRRSSKDNRMDRSCYGTHRLVAHILRSVFAVPALHFIIASNTKMVTG